jgi:hypothetical protein
MKWLLVVATLALAVEASAITGDLNDLPVNATGQNGRQL